MEKNNEEKKVWHIIINYIIVELEDLYFSAQVYLLFCAVKSISVIIIIVKYNDISN